MKIMEKRGKIVRTLLRNPLTWIIILATALRFYRLSDIGLHLDEASEYWIARAPITNIYELLSYHMHNAPPLSYVLAHVSLSLSDSTLFFRLPSVAAGVAGVGFVYCLGKYIGSETTGFVSAFLLSISPLHIYHSQEGRMYSLFCLFSILSLLFFIKLLKEDKRRHWILWACFTILNFYAHFFAALFLAAQLIYMVFRLANRWRVDGVSDEMYATMRKVAFSLLFVAVSVSPLLTIIMHPIGVGRFFSGPTLDWAFFKKLLAGFSTGSQSSMWIYFALFVLGSIIAFRKSRSNAGLLLGCIVIPLILANVYLRSRSYFALKYVIMSLPAFLLVVGLGATSLAEAARTMWRPQNRRVSASVYVGLCATLAAFAIPALVRYYPTGNLSGCPVRQPWEHCATFIRENAEPNDAVGFYQGYVQYSYDYYDREASIDRYWFFHGNAVDTLKKRSALLGRHYNYIPLGVYPVFNPDHEGISNMIEKYDRLWMMYNRPFPEEGTTFLKDFLGKNCQIVLGKNFGKGLELVLYGMKDGESRSREAG